MFGIRVRRSARRLLTRISQISVHRRVLRLARCCTDYCLGRLLSPTVDKIAVRAPCVATGELQRCGAAPAVGQDLAQIVADAEAQLRHCLHAFGAAVGRAEAAVLVGSLERGRVDALREVQQRLQVGATGGAWEPVCIERDAAVAFAEPLDLCVSGHSSLCGGARVARNHFQVLRDGHFRFRLAQVVVGAEAHHRHRVPC